MKTHTKIIILLFFIITHGYSQVLPIAKEINENGTTIYNTSLVNNYRGLIKAQGELMWTKIRNEVNFAKFDNNFYNTCFTSLRINEIVDKKAIINIHCFANESGVVYAASLSVYKSKILLTDAEVKCILTKAMAQKFNFTFKNGIFPFYAQISQPYKPERAFTNPKVAPDPSNPTGDPDYK
jgi:hypothetical protein